MDDQYIQELSQAKAELSDLRERGEEAVSVTWDDLRHELFTPEQIAQSDIRVALIMELVRARQERGISQKRLGELSGVKQPVIARMERGASVPNLSTIIKVLAPLGKTLYIGDLKST